MKKYRVSGPYAGFMSGVLQLTKEQYGQRLHALVPLGDGLYRVTAPTGFKRGEVIGFEGEVNKALVQEIAQVPSGMEEETSEETAQPGSADLEPEGTAPEDMLPTEVLDGDMPEGPEDLTPASDKQGGKGKGRGKK